MITLKSSSTIDFNRTCNHEIEKLYNWTVSNRLSINSDKTYYTIVSNINFSSYPVNIKINNHTINIKIHGLYLGVDFDCHLKFNFHIKNISNKISKSVGIIYRLRNFLGKQSLFDLYFSFIYPYPTHCNLMWGGTYACHLNLLIVRFLLTEVI